MRCSAFRLLSHKATLQIAFNLSHKATCTCPDCSSKHADLVVAQPQPIVQEVETDDMVMEGFAFGVPPGGGKGLREHLFHQLQMWLLIKGRVKAQDGPRALQMVPTQLQLCHCMHCTTQHSLQQVLDAP